ncbi:hypothetical protein D3C80_2082280 [compost metagenome]
MGYTRAGLLGVTDVTSRARLKSLGFIRKWSFVNGVNRMRNPKTMVGSKRTDATGIAGDS